MNTINLDNLGKELQEQYGEAVQVSADLFTSILQVQPSHLIQIMKTLREQYGFNHLANLTGVDCGEEFELVYHLNRIPDYKTLAVKTRVSRGAARVDSLFAVWPTADWQEREVYDLMGIQFNRHPNLIRVLLPDDFEGHPLRKDFQMGGEK